MANHSLYYYYAYNSSGDSYYGYTITDTGMYAEGLSYWPGTYDNEGGYWYFYVYDTYNYGYDTGSGGYDAVDTNYSYYDAQTGLYETYTGYSNYGGIGSSYGALASSGEYFGYYGYYEADAEPTDTLYYYLAYNTSGDYYYGYTIADDGAYAESSYYSYSVTDNDGGSWAYYIYDSYNYGYETDLEGYDAIDTAYSYYNGETSTFDSYTHNISYSGLGSSYGYVNTTGETFGYFGYYEADTTRLDTIYYYKAVNTSGDSYYGYVYDTTGKYYVGQSVGAYYNDNDGGYWRYEIYSKSDLGASSSSHGKSFFNSSYYYYDAESNSNIASSYTTGNAGIGSEYGYLVGKPSEYWGYFGSYEADGEPTDTEYYYLAVNTSGDFYYGIAYADEGLYVQGHTYYANFNDDDGGLWTYYIYGKYDYNYETGYEGISLVDGQHYYYDAESDSNYTFDAVTGYAGMGSEYGFLSGTDEAFGYQGLYEADEPTDTEYYYLAVNSTGDFYYGITFADTGTYAVGSTYYANFNDNEGGLWTYTVYGSYDNGYETGVEGVSFINGQHYYYDAQSDANLAYNAYTGYGGMGSEYGQLTIGTGDYFGYYGMYEADLY